MRCCVLAALLLAGVMGSSPEEELDKLALHVEHYPHAQGSNHAIYQFQIDEFATIYVHAHAPEHKDLPLNELVKASYSQRGVEGNSIEIPAIDSTQLSESF